MMSDYQYKAPKARALIIAGTREEAREFARKLGLMRFDYQVDVTPQAILQDEKIQQAILLDSWIERDDFLELNNALIARNIKRIRPCLKPKKLSTHSTQLNSQAARRVMTTR